MLRVEVGSAPCQADATEFSMVKDRSRMKGSLCFTSLSTMEASTGQDSMLLSPAASVSRKLARSSHLCAQEMNSTNLNTVYRDLTFWRKFPELFSFPRVNL